MAKVADGQVWLSWAEFRPLVDGTAARMPALEITQTFASGNVALLIAPNGAMSYLCELPVAGADYTDWSTNVRPSLAPYAGQASGAACDVTVEAESDANRWVLVLPGGTGDWTVVADTEHSNGYARKNPNTGTVDSMMATFRGRSVCIYGTKGPDKGIFDVDSQIFQGGGSFPVDCYAATEQHNTLLWCLDTERGANSHVGDIDEIQLWATMTNTKHASSSGNEVILDRFVFTSDAIKTQAYVVNPTRRLTEIDRVERDWGGNVYTKDEGPVVVTMDMRHFRTASLLLEATTFLAGATGATVTLQQGVEEGPSTYMAVAYTPENTPFVAFVADTPQRGEIDCLDEYLLVTITVTGPSGGSIEMDGHLTKR